MTYREIVYLVLDELKVISDDATYNELHILALLKTERAFILKQKYLSGNKEVADSNYQTLCMELEVADTLGNVPCVGGRYLRTKDTVPEDIGIASLEVYIADYGQYMITVVPKERFRYVGHNRYLQNIIYCSLWGDHRLYFKSGNPQHINLENIKVRGVFEDPEEAEKYACEDSDLACDIMDRDYPLEVAYIPLVVEMVKKELTGSLYRPQDKDNNASDDFSGRATGSVSGMTGGASSSEDEEAN